jgi:hypothetical protein
MSFYFLLVPCFKQPQFIQHVPMPNDDNFFAIFSSLLKDHHGMDSLCWALSAIFPIWHQNFPFLGCPKLLWEFHTEKPKGAHKIQCAHIHNKPLVLPPFLPMSFIFSSLFLLPPSSGHGLVFFHSFHIILRMGQNGP